MAVVPWHRYILLNEKARGGVFAVAITRREGRYAVVFVAIMAIATGLCWAKWLLLGLRDWYSLAVHDWFSDAKPIILVAAGAAFYLVLIVAHLYPTMMLSLALPAVAVDRNSGFRAAVALVYGNCRRLVLVFLAVGALYYAYYFGIGHSPVSLFEGFHEIVWAVACAVIYVFEALIAATALSLSYHALGGMHGDPPASAVVPPGGDV